jgi:hypothetical protein
MSATAAPTSASTTVDPFIAELRRQVGQGIQLTAEEYQLLADADAKAGAAYNPPGGQGALNGFVGYPQTSTANPGMSQDEWNAYKAANGLPSDSTYDESTGKITLGTGASTTSYSAGLTGGTGAGGTGNQNTGADEGQWEINPGEAYRISLGIPAVGGNLFSQWQENQYNPTYGAYLAQSQVNPAAEGTMAQSFADYMKNTGIMGARQQSRSLFNSLAGMDKMKQQDIYESTDGYGLSTAGQGLVQSALASRYGNPLAKIMASKVGSLYDRYKTTTEYNDPNASFLSYLKGKYGL